MRAEKCLALANFLKFIHENYKLRITLNDCKGMFAADKNLYDLYMDYNVHGNEYCMYIKSNQELWNKCLLMKEKILAKCESETGIFCGTCYAGIKEYIIPVKCNRDVIAFICVGIWDDYDKFSSHLIANLVADYNLSRTRLIEHYNSATSKKIPEIRLINNIFAIVSEYIVFIYEELLLEFGESVLSKGNKENEDYVLSHIIAYLKRNYKNDISLEEISHFCNYSKSYISHLFSNRMNINIKAYLNNIRVEQAKRLLIQSNTPISDIAYQTGFNDSNYFSKVFKDICGINPTQYRKNTKEID